jgi:alkylation response protein AidB-like acyl-CoA dehydrogenase
VEIHARTNAISDERSRAKGDELVAWLRDWSERRLSSRLMDERRSIPPYVALDLGNRGFFGMQVDEKYGGLALRTREVARLHEQAAAIDLSFGTFLLVCLFPGVRPIAAFGSPAVKDALLPDLARGRILAGFAQTEPGAGTHFPAMAARAVATGDGAWSLSGDKVWIGNASWSGVLTVMAHDVDASGRRRGLTAFAVPTDRRGVQPGAELLSMGMRAVVQNEVAFRDVAVGLDDVLGEPRRGLEVGVDSMSWSRFAIAATCVGSMKQCARLALRFATRRQIVTGRLADHPVVREALAEAAAKTAAAESLLYRVAADVDAERGAAPELFAACKLAASEFLWETADRAVQILGSRGYDEENGLAQTLRDARVTRIFEGASEALVAFLGAQVLSPRSQLIAYLRDDLRAARLAERLEAAAGALRERPGGADAAARAAHCALAGWAGLWALLAGCLAADPQRAPGALRGRAAGWAELRCAAACERAERGGEAGRLDLDAAALEEVSSAWEDAIGDVEQRLPGERLGLDPLLRKQPARPA